MKYTRKISYLAISLATLLTVGSSVPAISAINSSQNHNPDFMSSDPLINGTLLARWNFSGRYGSAQNRRTTGFRRGGCLPANQEVIAILPHENEILNSSLVELESPMETEVINPENNSTLGDLQPNLEEIEVDTTADQIELNTTEKTEETQAQETTNQVWFTASEYPSVYFYVPQNWAEKGRFVLYDENKEIIYSALLKLPGEATEAQPREAGILEVSFMDQEVPPLVAGNNYLWEVEILCHETDHSGNPFVNGWIQKIDEDSNQALIEDLAGVSDPTEQNQIYAENSIWYNLVSNIYHNSNADDWQMLLEQVGTPEIANSAILGEVTILETLEKEIVPIQEDLTTL